MLVDVECSAHSELDEGVCVSLKFVDAQQLARC